MEKPPYFRNLCIIIRMKWSMALYGMYRATSNTSRTKSQNIMFLLSSCSSLGPIHGSWVLSREWRCSWSSADTAPTTPGWSTIILPTKVWLILEIWLYIQIYHDSNAIIVIGETHLELLYAPVGVARTTSERSSLYCSIKCVWYWRFDGIFKYPMHPNAMTVTGETHLEVLYAQ